MSKFFVALYDWLRCRRSLLWIVLIFSALLMGFYASKLSLDEDIISVLPNDKRGNKTATVFNSLRIKDKIIIMVSAPQALKSDAPDLMIEAAEAISMKLQEAVNNGLLSSLTVSLDGAMVDSVSNFVYHHLPAFYTPADFYRLDSITTPEAIGSAIARSRQMLGSPAGIAIKDILLRDPLGLGSGLLSQFERFNTTSNYQIYDDHIFTSDLETLLIIATPNGSSSASSANEQLVSTIESSLESVETQYGVHADYFASLAIAVYNARQIKNDTMVTLTIALLLIVVVITFAFRNRWATLLMLLPVLYGVVFSLALIFFIQGSISTIAIGAGAAVMGIALSYSIHVLAHSNHTGDPRQIISELAYPLTVGSFTTVGAFLGLTFTQSRLLYDFGLFSAFTLIGTTLFCLIFLPHFLPKKASHEVRSSRFLKFIERINGYAFHSNKWLVGLIGVAIFSSFFLFDKVRFDSDMTHLSYIPERFQQAERKLQETFGSNDKFIYLVSSSTHNDSACDAYQSADRLLDSLHGAGALHSYTSASEFVSSASVQQQRLDQWRAFWSPARQSQVCGDVRRAALSNGLRSDAFAPFEELLARDFSPFDPHSPSVANNPVLGDWINRSDSLSLFVSRISLDEHDKQTIYPLLEQLPDLTILDRSYFASRMASVLSDDFNTILYISSILVFFALLLSYGRIELAVLASLPMLISWLLILGMMALFGIEFNIVNIILSTFIFGLGDDFSIFIMDGLLNEYKDGRQLLSSHKTAIFFSAFTTVVGIGALIFADHPALRSVSVISIVGMLAVLLVAYTIQPILFRLFITAQTARGGFPYTFLGLLNTIYAFVYFLSGCLLLQVAIAMLWLIPLGRCRRKRWLHGMMYGFTRLFLNTMFTNRTERLNPTGEDFSRPSVIIANHQSFIDILLMLSTTPKLVMVTNGWVWRSPFFGRIVRYADFVQTADGYERLVETLREPIAQGFSVLVFPEGTRTNDGSIQRFHKGAFYLAEQLRLDIVPIMIYGAGLISSKRQPFYIKKGRLVSSILPRIAYDDPQFGESLRDRAKLIRRHFCLEYESLKAIYSSNPHFRESVIKNFTFKGPVLEWYMRVKLSLERNYDQFDALLPRSGRIVDLGCGYGQMSFILALRGEAREIIGVDFDPEKIAIAQHSFLCSERLQFVCADLSDYPLPVADAYVINDVLHYVTPERQQYILGQCVKYLSVGGLIIIREGDSSNQRGQRRTAQTERWSTKILGFNKSCGELYFSNGEFFSEFALHHGLSFEVARKDAYTSNTLYVMRKSNINE